MRSEKEQVPIVPLNQTICKLHTLQVQVQRGTKQATRLPQTLIGMWRMLCDISIFTFVYNITSSFNIDKIAM